MSDQPIKAGETKTDLNTQFVSDEGKTVKLEQQQKPDRIDGKPEPRTETKPDIKPDDKSKEAPEITFDDFALITGEPTKPSHQITKEPQEQPLPDELKTKPDVIRQPQEEVVKPRQEKIETKSEDELEDKVNRRDYSGISDEHVPLFKKMGGKSFDFLKPLYLEHKKQQEELTKTKAELEQVKKGGLPASYFEHPRGYTLSREFEGAADNAIKARMIAEHWENQLNKIRKGEETYTEINYDAKSGQFYESKPIQATKESEAEITNYVRGAREQAMERQLVLKNMATTHQGAYKEAVKSVLDFENASFKQFSGENAETFGPLVNDTIAKIFPPAFHNNPLITGYVKALLTIQQIGEAYKKLQEQKGGETVVKGQNGAEKKVNTDDRKKAGPTSGDMTGGAGEKKNGEDVTFDMFTEITGRR